MSEPRVARLDIPAPHGEPVDVLDLGEVGAAPVGAVASLGDVPGARSAASVADLDGVGRAEGAADGPGTGGAPTGPGAGSREADHGAVDRDGPGRDAPDQDGGPEPADLDAISAGAPGSVRLARLDGAAPRHRRRGAGRQDAGAGGPPSPEGAGAATGERDPRPPRTRRPPGPAQIDPDADPVAAAREICLRLLTDRARTRTELAHALARRGVPAEAADAVLERFDEVGLIDDAAFAGQWVRSRHRHRGLARRAIAQELRRKGVDDEVVGEALAEVDGESEARRARELVDRKLRTMPAGTSEQRTTAARRLVGMLARKGYGAGVAYGVVKEALAEHGADHDELGPDELGPDELGDGEVVLD